MLLVSKFLDLMPLGFCSVEQISKCSLMAIALEKMMLSRLLTMPGVEMNTQRVYVAATASHNEHAINTLLHKLFLFTKVVGEVKGLPFWCAFHSCSQMIWWWFGLVLTPPDRITKEG